jgi:hypothetical protein
VTWNDLALSELPLVIPATLLGLIGWTNGQSAKVGCRPEGGCDRTWRAARSLPQRWNRGQVAQMASPSEQVGSCRPGW